jgi:hypothetical protein
LSDLDDTIDTGGHLMQQEDSSGLCYIRGPEGVLIGLAEELGNGIRETFESSSQLS